MLAFDYRYFGRSEGLTREGRLRIIGGLPASSGRPASWTRGRLYAWSTSFTGGYVPALLASPSPASSVITCTATGPR